MRWTLDFSHNLDALGRCVERRQAQIAARLPYPCDVTLAFDENGEARADDLWTTTTAADYVKCNCGDHLIPVDCEFFKIDSGSLKGEIHHQIWTPCMRKTAIEVTERGSLFARRPDETSRPRRKRGDPPPPMSDLLGEPK